jgi:hypothetical protein
MLSINARSNGKLFSLLPVLYRETSNFFLFSSPNLMFWGSYSALVTQHSSLRKSVEYFYLTQGWGRKSDEI